MSEKEVEMSMLLSVDDEEYERLAPLSERTIRKALAAGAEARSAAQEQVPVPSMSRGIRFR